MTLCNQVNNVEVLLVWTISCLNIVGWAEGRGVKHVQIHSFVAIGSSFPEKILEAFSLYMGMTAILDIFSES